jgi:hypothetical protein
MNQAIEQAIIKHTNDVWEDGHGQGVYEEQERIIKLLESHEGDVLVPVKFAIRLIKGETE